MANAERRKRKFAEKNVLSQPEVNILWTGLANLVSKWRKSDSLLTNRIIESVGPGHLNSGCSNFRSVKKESSATAALLNYGYLRFHHTSILRKEPYTHSFCQTVDSRAGQKEERQRFKAEMASLGEEGKYRVKSDNRKTNGIQ